jgi:hypothetical protein
MRRKASLNNSRSDRPDSSALRSRVSPVTLHDTKVSVDTYVQ